MGFFLVGKGEVSGVAVGVGTAHGWSKYVRGNATVHGWWIESVMCGLWK
jgi:hypothetical protein